MLDYLPRIPAVFEPDLFLVVAMATAILFVFLWLLGRKLQTDQAPKGIIGLELESQLNSSIEMVKSWSDRGATGNAYLSIALDFLLIAGYSCVLIVTCSRGVDFLAASYPRISTIGIFVTWGVVIAAGLDAVENVLMLRLIGGHGSEGSVYLTSRLARAKFGLIALAIGFSLIALGATAP